MFIKKIIMICAVFLALVIAGCNNEKPIKEEVIQHNWNESPLFKSGSFTMIGEEGRLGFIYDDSEVVRFYPDKVQKYMWHFWGNNDELIGNFKVLGTHENSDEEIIVVPTIGNSFPTPHNGADQHFPTNMMLPKSGMWKLDAYFGDELFGSVYVKVHKK
ncbi:hypothetical protein QTL97_16665 [Sporosarcina thermotolerans]|uniref:DUF4871 domain-containing protein n=1 Tax=Sporosarcina thermotolerans TaxID=633404 RepID=A0AAW9AAX5_9BACL|nr:hypothetical protein [Sporosarcina thermotolerans]MDW0118562.1 hypothetical protein [Sporosarcina thermotolerans]WHT49493.1 hypothetical protein QNH10_08255 [Sporosarcina thermotolerans]